MRKGLLAALLVLLPGMGDAFAQSCNGCGIGYWYAGVPATGGTFTGSVVLTSGNSITLFNTADMTTNTERAILQWSGNTFAFSTAASGSGTLRNFQFTPGGGQVVVTGTIRPGADDAYDLGLFSTVRLWSSLGLSRSIMGGKSKALTGGSATTFLRVSVAQTAAANYGGGSVGYTVYATDGTDSQSLVGDVRFAMVNKAGTETCAIGEEGTPVLAQSSGSTLTCTFTCATAAADTVDLAANCASGLVETTFTIEYRGDMQKLNTYTPQ